VPLNHNLVLGSQEFSLEFRDRKRFDPLKVSALCSLSELNFNSSESEAQPGAAKLHHRALLSSSLIHVGPVTEQGDGRAIAQAVGRRLPTAAARVRAQVRSCGIRGGTKWHWGGFPPSTSVSPANSHSTDCSTLIIVYHPGLVE
jgi:hypothetical protein